MDHHPSEKQLTAIVYVNCLSVQRLLCLLQGRRGITLTIDRRHGGHTRTDRLVGCGWPGIAPRVYDSPGFLESDSANGVIASEENC